MSTSSAANDCEILWLQWQQSSKEPREAVLILRIDDGAPRLSQAANILWAVMACETPRTPMEALETAQDVTEPVLRSLQREGVWTAETYALMVQMDGMRAVGLGHNKKHRERTASIALALCYILRSKNPMMKDLSASWSLQSLVQAARDARVLGPLGGVSQVPSLMLNDFVKRGLLWVFFEGMAVGFRVGGCKVQCSTSCGDLCLAFIMHVPVSKF